MMLRRIAIHSVPRSGSSWLGQVLNSSPRVVYKYQPLFSYAFKDALSPLSSRSEIVRFFESIAQRSDDFLDQTEAVLRGIYPRFEKVTPATHIVYKEVRYHHILENLLKQDDSAQVVGLVRNPLAVLASWKNAPKEFKPEWDFASEWRAAQSKNQGRPEEFYGFDKWVDVAELFQRLAAEYPQRFRLVLYRDLVREPTATAQGLFEWAAIPWHEQTETFLRQSRSEDHADTYSVFNSKTDDNSWKAQLPADVVVSVQEILASKQLERFLV